MRKGKIRYDGLLAEGMILCMLLSVLVLGFSEVSLAKNQDSSDNSAVGNMKSSGSLNREKLYMGIGDFMVVSAIFDDILEKSESPYEFISSDSSIVTIDASLGLLKARKAGQTSVSLRSAGQVIDTADVYVVKPAEKFIYVSPNGSDVNGEGSEGNPFATMEKARDHIRTMGDLPEGGVTVYLREGRYYLEQPIVFTPEDSGKEGAPVIYRSYPGEHAIIHSGRSVTGFQKLEGDLPSGMGEAAAANVYVADIARGWRPHDLYANGERQQIARQFNTNDWHQWAQFPPGIVSPRKQTDAAEKGILVTLQPGSLDHVPDNGDVEMYLLPVVWWNSLPVLGGIDAANASARLLSFNPSIGTSDFESGTFQHLFQYNGRYNLMNVARFLDEPGEWSVDSKAGKIYWWPKNIADLQKAVAPFSDELIRLQGDEEAEGWQKQVSFIEFRNLEFAYTDRKPEDRWSETRVNPALTVRNAENPFAAIFMQGVSHCAVIDSVVRHTGSYAIAFDHYAQNNRVVRNQLNDLGGGGVQIYGYGPGTTDVNRKNTVLANRIFDIGRAPYQHASGITVFGSGYNDVKFNKMNNMPYTATMIVGADADSMNPKHFNKRAFTDTFGNANTQYSLRMEELKALPESARFDTSVDNGRSAMPYQHSEFNIFEYNASYEYMMDMDDGGCYYGWSAGKNNEYNFNIARKSSSGKGYIWPLYSDDYFSYARWEGNHVWAPQTETLDKSDGTNLWKNNENSATQTPGFVNLEKKIFLIVEEQMGGYLDVPDRAQ